MKKIPYFRPSAFVSKLYAMKLYEKIKKIREDMGLTIQDVHDRGITIFGPKKALSYRTLQRIEKGQLSKFSSVLKICCALGITLEKLIEETELEDRMVIRKNERLDEYTYNDKVFASITSCPSRSFLAMELTLEPGGTTMIEQSPEHQSFEKWIYVVEGELTCHLGEETFLLKKKDAISFNSSIRHRFENLSGKKCVCAMVQNPKHF
ncbi:MAG: cupin domain-containing protein [Candidatus Omnitrophota bacterium]